TEVAFQNGKARNPLAARSNQRAIHPRDGPWLSDDRSSECADRESDIPSRQNPAIGCRARNVSEHRRIQKLARHVVQPANPCVLYSDESELRERNVRTCRKGCWKRRHRSRAARGL